MWQWLKSLIPTPKTILADAIDGLDLLVPIMADKIESIKTSFNALDSKAKAQWIVDEVQAFLRKQFGLV